MVNKKKLKKTTDEETLSSVLFENKNTANFIIGIIVFFLVIVAIGELMLFRQQAKLNEMLSEQFMQIKEGGVKCELLLNNKDVKKTIAPDEINNEQEGF